MSESRYRILGVDLSMNHAAFVLLVPGSVMWFRFVTARKAVLKKSDDVQRGTFLSASKIKDMNERDFYRLDFWSAYSELILKIAKPTHVGLEDYAYRAPMYAHQIGSVAGLFRLATWRYGAKIRLVEPGTVKMFAAHDGSCFDISGDGIEKWPEAEVFKRYVAGADTQTMEDLCDAYSIAKIVQTEIGLREGSISLTSLHSKEIQVFNRCTKRWPVKLLARDWIQKRVDGEDGTEK